MDGDVRVLVVDDDPDIAHFVRTVLHKAGLHAVACVDPLEALALAAREPFDAAITDIEMPGMNGLEFIGRLRELHPDLPVVVMTAHASVDYAVEALRRNADEFMVKPVRRDDVVATLARWSSSAAPAGHRPATRPCWPSAPTPTTSSSASAARWPPTGRPATRSSSSRSPAAHAAARPATAWASRMAAAELLGARLFMEDLEDTRISESDPTVSIIERVVAQVQPTIVYTHSAHDRHQDHRAVHRRGDRRHPQRADLRLLPEPVGHGRLPADPLREHRRVHRHQARAAGLLRLAGRHPRLHAGRLRPGHQPLLVPLRRRPALRAARGAPRGRRRRGRPARPPRAVPSQSPILTERSGV